MLLEKSFDLSWRWLRFENITGAEMHHILALRQQVFIVEQNCIYSDADEYDASSYHLLGEVTEDNVDHKLVVYLRLTLPGTRYDEPSIGRVLTRKMYRGKGFADRAVAKAIRKCHSLCGTTHVRVDAQLYLQNFYEKHGFKPIGESYDEDGIEHIQMRLYQ